MRNFYILKSIINKVKLLLILILIFSYSGSAQSTEFFTNDGDGTTTFSDNGLNYTLTGSYLKVENYGGYGWNSSVLDDWYVDNIDNIMVAAGVIGSITNSGSDFYVHDLYVAPGDVTPYISNSGNVIIRGKLDGTTQFTYTLLSGSINTSGAVNNYFTYVNLSSYSTTRIDELEFELTGSLRYLAIDAFKHSAAAGNSKPTASSFTASPIYQNTAYAFATANFGYSDSDGDPLAHLRITAVPGTGTLWIDADADGIIDGSENTITNGETITKVELDAGKFKYINTSGSSSSFTFDVNDGTDYSASTYTATLTVTPEPTVTLSLDPISSISENGGTTNVKATLSHTFNKTVTVNLSVTGTAIGSDYSITASSIPITSGNTNNTVTITGVDDGLMEGSETVIVDISSVTNGSESGTQQVTCTLTDDDEPEINIKGNTISIADGDASPSSADHTDFGSVNASSGTIVRTFTIENTGTAALNLTGSSPHVSISGTNASDFSITVIPSTPIAASNSTTFQVTFNPSAIGTRTASISIANDDSDENPYNFSIRGTGLNSAPTLTSVSTLTGATEDDPFTISYATLAAAADEADSDGDAISFRVESVSSGTLTKGGSVVTPGSTLLSSGESWVWTPAANANGTLSAFTVKAWDGILASSSAVQVSVNVVADVAPTVTTAAASSITETSATLGGNATSDGGDAISEKGIVYSTTDETPTIAEGATKDANGSGTGIFSESIGSLTANTTYYYNAYATNLEGTSYGTASSFATLPIAATITTQEVSNITTTTATGNGNITSLGVPNPTQYGVCWNTSGNPTASDNKTQEGGVSITGAFTSSITSLSPNTTYYVKAYATNTAGTSYGSQVSFTTYPLAATVTTQSVSSIASTNATGNGNITNLGAPNPTQHGVCWNTSGDPTTSDNKTQEGAVSITGAFTSSITSLSPNTTYYVKAYATNTAGTSYGTEVSFTSLPLAATVTTQAVTSISTTTATGNGNITDLGVPNPTAYGVCWNTSGTPTIGDSNTSNGAASSTGAFTSSITSLSPNTTYYVRAYVTNTAGTSYGSQVSFTTSPLAATVTTQAATNITSSSITGNGNITDLGIPNPTQHGFCYNKTGSPSLSDSHLDMGAVSSTGAFLTTIYFLDPNTTYYLKAYATNTAGTSFGDEVSFTTLAEAPTVITNAATSLSGSGATLNGTVNAKNASTTVTFDYGLTAAYGFSVDADQGPVTGTSDTDVSKSLTGLEPNTTYHYRVVGINVGGTTYGFDQTFVTDAIAPTVTTLAATDVTAKGITFHGIVNANNASTTVTIEMGTTIAYGIISEVDQSPVSGSSDVIINYSSYGYTPNTTYHYRVVGVNAGGTTYGEDVAVTTLTQEPLATTVDASSIGTTSVILNGIVNANELSTDVTFEYGLTTSYGTTVAAVQSPLSAGWDENVNQTITGLIPNTTYHYRVVADNSEGTAYGDDLTLTTATIDPTLFTGYATELSSNSATLNGYVNPNNYSTVVTFEYGLTAAYGSTITADQSPVTGNTEQTVSADIAGLSPYTTYHFRVVGESIAGSANGDDLTFTTSSAAAIVTTQPVTAISESTATANGNITDLGAPAPTAHGVCWNTSGTPTTNDNVTDEGAASATGAFTSTISELIPNTTYYVRAYATNTAGTAYGDDVSFTSLAQAPRVTTQTATNLEANTVNLNGTVNANNSETVVTFEYGLSTAYGTSIAADENPVDGLSDTQVSKEITGLNPNTIYHYRVVGVNSAGTTNGDDQTFTTIKHDQVITFDALPNKTTADVDFDPGATSDQELIISYTSSNELVATIVDELIHIIGAGTTEITASQAGNDTVNIATPVSQTLTVTEATGIENAVFANIKVYPNPLKDILNIDMCNISILDNVVISIFDLSGKILYQDKISDVSFKIDVSDFSSGIYFVEIKSIKGVKKLKLVKE